MVTERDKRYLDIITEIKNISAIDNSINNYREILDDCEKEIANKEFRITIVGQFSSGKSTFLNALIGRDLLTRASKETTATITYIHNVPETDKRINTQIIKFLDKREDVVLPLESDKIKEYTTTFGENVAHNIKSVDVYVHFTDIDYPVVLVDTPGLNGMAEGHRAITIREIERSHASICLLDVVGVADADREIFDFVTKNQNTYFFVLNQIDRIHKSEGKSPDEYIKDFKDNIKKIVYADQKEPEYIFGISGMKALEARDKSVYPKNNDGKALSKEEADNFLKQSRIESLEKALYSYLQSCDKEQEFYNTISSRLSYILDRIKGEAVEEKQTREIQKENIPEKAILEQKKSKIVSEIEGYRKEIENSLVAKVTEEEKKFRNSSDQYWDSQETKICDDINKLDNIESAKNAVESNTFGKYLVDTRGSFLLSLEENIQEALYEVYDTQLLEIKERLPEIKFESDGKVTVSVDRKKFDESNISVDNSEEKRLRSEIENSKKKLSSIDNLTSVDEVQKELYRANRELDNLESRKRSAENRLGSRPSAERKAIYRIEDTASTVAKIFSFGFYSNKEHVFDHYEYDDSKGEEWDSKRDDIDYEYDSKIESQERTISSLKKQLEKVQKNDAMARQLTNAISKLENELIEERKHQKMLEQEAKSSLLKKIKGDLHNGVSQSINEIKDDIKGGITDNFRESRTVIVEQLKSFYFEKTNHYIKMIDQLISQIENKGDNKDNADKISLLAKDIHIIESIESKLKNIA